MSLGAPPAKPGQALALARELTAIAGHDTDPGALSALAEMLITGRYPGDDEPPLNELATPALWRFAFREDSPDILDALVTS